METRETFFNRLEPHFAPSILLDIQLAYTLAKYAHRAQVRTEVDKFGEPIRYFEHVRRVAFILVDEVGILDSKMVIASLLHDGIEDTKDLTPEMIEHCFGIEVVSLVKTLSKVPKEGYLERFRNNTDWRAYVIKGCDRLDNLRSLDHMSKDHWKKQVKETSEKMMPLFDRMITLAPMDYKGRSSWLRDSILKENTRREAMIEFDIEGF